MQLPAEPRRWQQVVAELRRHCRGQILDAAAAVYPYTCDFGGMIERCPAAVLQVNSEHDVSIALRVAAEHDISVTARGAGHGQSGQSLGEGLILDMTRLAGVSMPGGGSSLVEAEAGATWEHVCNTTLQHGLLPVGLTHALDTTLAGTLSVAGVGAESFRSGPQVDNVLYFDVALIDGRVVRCSREELPELFDTVRGGFGQCGVIVRVGYPVRPSTNMVHTRCLAYGDPKRAVRDLSSLCDPRSAARWVTASTARDPRGPGRWLLLLFVAHDTEELVASTMRRAEPSPDFEIPWRPGFLWSLDGSPRHPFFRRFGTGQPELGSVNPWVEHIFSAEGARDALELLFAEHVDLLDWGKVGVIPIRRLAGCAPLFASPDSELLLGVGAFATFPQSERAAAEAMMSSYEARLRPFGGKRYLSGFQPRRSSAEWAQHYGSAWAAFRACKTRLDPRRLLNPGFIEWD